MEEWREIKGSNGYQVSALGQIRSTGNKARVLKPYDNGRGYAVVDLYYGNKRRPRVIHSIVAEVFIGARTPNKPEINHKNANKRDNRVCNLEYVTRSSNMKHAYMHGRIDIAKALKARKFWRRDSLGRFVCRPQES